MMRLFYTDEGPIDQLLQIATAPVWDGDLISKEHRTAFVNAGWVAQCEGWNIITPEGEHVIRLLKLKRPSKADNLRRAFVENDIPLGPLA